MWPHLLGLDAPLVAITWQWWWAHTRGVYLPPSRYFVLGFSVWLIYLADRSADSARTIPGERLADRHAFSACHRTPIRWLMGLVGLTLVATTPLFLPRREFAGGLALLGVTGIYYWTIHHARRVTRPFLPKEAMVGGMFSIGSAFFTACLLPRPVGGFLLDITCFSALCFLNCGLITAWEQCPRDQADAASMLNHFPRLTANLGRASFLLALFACFLALWQRSASLGPVALSALALWMLERSRGYLSACALRVLADMVLLTPLFALGWQVVAAR